MFFENKPFVEPGPVIYRFVGDMPGYFPFIQKIQAIQFFHDIRFICYRLFQSQPQLGTPSPNSTEVNTNICFLHSFLFQNFFQLVFGCFCDIYHLTLPSC
jgi:hypothetical protein